MVKLEDNTASIDVFYKPTDTHQYLMTSVKKSIFYSQGLRSRRILSKEEKIKERVKELGWMVKEGYKTLTLDVDVGRIQE